MSDQPPKCFVCGKEVCSCKASLPERLRVCPQCRKDKEVRRKLAQERAQERAAKP